MDLEPISFGIDLELGGVFIALVAAIATWLHHRGQQKTRQQRERHHREHMVQSERHHQERISTMRDTEQLLEERPA
jgi:hypothetical protein